MSANRHIARRSLLLGGLAGLGLAALALFGYEAPRLLAPRYPRTPYDDLFARLADRHNAILVGSAVLAEKNGFNAQQTAHALRMRLKTETLADIVEKDLSDGHVIEVRGWILPSSLAALCALAASASQPRTPSGTRSRSPIQTSRI